MNVRMRVAIIGPLAPPAGGMAAQTRQLGELLAAEGLEVEVVQTNAPYRPAAVGRVRGIRAAFRLIPYAMRLWRAAGRSAVFHVMANSGWAWHLFAAPAIWIGKARGVRVVVNYRGGSAQTFLARSVRFVRPTLRMADAIVVPSGYLQGVFASFGVDSAIIPNVVDTVRFRPGPGASGGPAKAPHVVVARNLERIYDIPTALRAFAAFRRARPDAKLSVAGTGPERASLERLVGELNLSHSVTFCGALSRDAMADLYRSATMLLNSSIVDNTPNSLLEAMACGVPIVSTGVGGIPFLVQDGVTAMLVPPEDPAALARAMQAVTDDPGLAARLVDNGLELARRCAWSNVGPQWMQAYRFDADDRPRAPLADPARPSRRVVPSERGRERAHDEVRG